MKRVLVSLSENQEIDEYKDHEKKWIAYEMFMRCMHPNGISYNIIKDRLPVINEEISKFETLELDGLVI